MLKNKLISLAVLSAVASVAQAGGIPKDITLEGFCDGVHFVKDKDTGTVTGNRTGCDSGNIAGASVGKNIAFNDSDNRYQLLNIINADGTFAYYSNVNGALLLSGTWVKGAPSEATASKGKSTAR